MSDYVTSRLESLSAFTVDELRQEILILNGVWVPDGVRYSEKLGVFYLQVGEQFISLLHSGVSEYPWDEGQVGPGQWGPGWAWYINDRPGVEYRERGGACLFMRALDEAKACVATL